MSDLYSEYIERLRSQRAASEAEEKAQSDTSAIDRLASALQPVHELAKALLDAGEISRIIEPVGDAREVKVILEGPNRKFAVTVCCRDIRKTTPPQLTMTNTLFDLPAESPPDLLFAIRGTTGVERKFEYNESDIDIKPVLDHLVQTIAVASRR